VRRVIRPCAQQLDEATTITEKKKEKKKLRKKKIYTLGQKVHINKFRSYLFKQLEKPKKKNLFPSLERDWKM
jgi:hypothetical protein